MSKWRIERLIKQHQRAHFDCGDKELNFFLSRYVGQNDRRDISRTFVACCDDLNVVKGYYTLSSGCINFEDIPDKKKVAQIPCAHCSFGAFGCRYERARARSCRHIII